VLNIGIEVLKYWKRHPERMITKGRFSLECTSAYLKLYLPATLLMAFNQLAYICLIQMQFLKKLMVLAQYHFREILGHVTIIRIGL